MSERVDVELMSELEALRAENAALKKTRDALISKIERDPAASASPFRLFERNLALTQELQARTEELEEQRERLRLAMEGACDGFWDYEPSTSRVWYSNRFLELLGIAAEDVSAFPPVFSSFTERLHPEDREATLEAVQAHLSGERPYDVVYRLRVEGGEYRWFRARGQAHWNEAGEVTRMAGSIQDITPQREAESELRDSESFLRAILDGQTAHIAILDHKGDIIATNAAWQRFWGRAGDTNKSARKPNYVSLCGRPEGPCEKEANAVSRAIRRVLLGESEHESVNYPCSCDEGRRWFQVSITPVSNDNAGVVVAHYDITSEIEAREALAKANQTNRLLALVAQHTDNAAIVTDRNVRIEWVNAGFTRITGYTLDEVKGRVPGHVLQGPATDPQTVAAMRDGIRSGRGFDIEIENYGKHGDRYWLAAEVRPIHDDNGQVERFIAIQRDITEERARGQRLRLLEAAIDNASESMLTIARDGTIAEVNPEACRRLGYSRDELTTLKIWDVDEGVTQELWPSTWNEATTTGGRRAPTAYLTREGETNPVDVSHALVRHEGSDYLCAFARDMSQECAIRQQLDEERSLLREILSTIPYLVFWKDRDLRYEGCNRRFAEVSGLENVEAIVGKTDSDISWARDQVASYREYEKSVLSSGVPRLHETETKRGRDGTVVTYEASRVPLRDEHGEICGVIGIYCDVTEQRQLEDRLHRAQKLESIGQLAAGIAHEINTPTQYVGDNTRFVRESIDDLLRVLEAYQGAIAATKQGDVETPCVSSVEAIAREVDLEFLREELPRSIDETLEGIERISEIVRAMKEFSHPGSKEKESIDLNHALESTITVCRNRWKYVAELQKEFDPELPPVMCLAGEFNQVILNLIVNAADAIAERFQESELGLILVETRHDSEHVEIRVTDNGGGIPEDVQRRVFDPFFTTKEVGEGTGQGLAISHDVVVNKHGGTIELDSIPGEGTTFTLRIPIC